MPAYMKRDDVIVLLVANLAGPMAVLHGASNVEDQVIDRAISYADKLQAKGVIGEQSLTDAFAELRHRVEGSLPQGDLDLADDLDVDDDEPEVTTNAEGGRDFTLKAETGVFTSKATGDAEPAPAQSDEPGAIEREAAPDLHD